MSASHVESIELLRKAALEGDRNAIVAYERAMWRLERDSGDDSKKGRGKVSRNKQILDELNS